MDTAWAETIDNHVADVITNSWTDGIDDISLLGADYVQFYQQFSLEAALTGITVGFSSRDGGDNTNGGANPADRTVEFPADLPYVTGVGGTSIGIGRDGGGCGSTAGKGRTPRSPTVRGRRLRPGTYSSGGGGGTSVLFGQPFYQKGRLPASIAKYFGGRPMRAVPDISMNGDPNSGFLVGQAQVFSDGTYWTRTASAARACPRRCWPALSRWRTSSPTTSSAS